MNERRIDDDAMRATAFVTRSGCCGTSYGWHSDKRRGSHIRRHPGGTMAERQVDVEDQVEKVAKRLSDEYADRVPGQVVLGLVHEAYGQLRGAKVTQFVPVLVDRSVGNGCATAPENGARRRQSRLFSIAGGVRFA
jgi:hypothetical protein